METIKILPHHAPHYFRIFFFGRDVKTQFDWYDDKLFQAKGENIIQTVVSDPSQPVNIIGRYDSFCNICPRNRRGSRFMQRNFPCIAYEENYESESDHEIQIAEDMGIANLINKESITAKAFFEALAPFYHEIFNGSTLSPYLQRSFQYEIWKDFFGMDSLEIERLKKRDQHLLAKDPNTSLIDKLFTQRINL